MQASHNLNGDLWNREHFDWAEDVEEEILKTEATMIELSLSPPFDWAEEVEDEILKTEATMIDLALSPPFDWAEEVEDEIFKAETAAQQERPCSPIGWDEDEKDGIIKRKATKSIAPIYCDRSTLSWESLQEQVDNEFGWQEKVNHQVGPVHHFNWSGKAVFERSGTLPEESLAIIRAWPKVPKHKDDPDYRVQAILWNANNFLDPVVLTLDDVDRSVLELHGSALIHAAKGHVSKHYTGRGWWLTDDKEEMLDSSLDVGDVEGYLEPNVVVGNGFAEVSILPTREEHATIANNMITWAAAEANERPYWQKYRKLYFEPTRSPLHQVATIVPDESESTRAEASTIVPMSDDFDSTSVKAITIVSVSDESDSTPVRMLCLQPSPSSESVSPLFDEMMCCDVRREPTPPWSNSSCEPGCPFHDEPALVLCCDRQRQPTPPSSSSHSCPSLSYSFESGSQNDCQLPTSPELPVALAGCLIAHEPVIMDDRGSRSTYQTASSLRRKPLLSPLLRCASGSSASPQISTLKAPQQRHPIASPTGLVNNDKPSRDPEVFYSFPKPRDRGSKIKRFFKKAGKILLSGLGMPTQPLYSPNCFDVVPIK
ncbi:uncharacterized protein N7484_004846 [Penicillium longicatenatum]|uniref:uncharacterized protein n=1 Tax=Penicillium longicatenatum TaxID=1561947 RepID=UPI0025487CD1|nr:uncharacterized protein N7484_004846 [Penicillium longicatenatum]KAJ5651123.1 hypothetical protein N7484_004846 [Penicillium longicatenatum]